jgi:hypothetical protein
MWHAASTLAITGGTIVNSPHATFLNKGQQIGVTVDGGKGARLHPRDGIIVQVIDNDDPGPVIVNGVLENAGVYTQPTGEPAKDATFDVTVAHATDSVLSFTDIELAGNASQPAINNGVLISLTGGSTWTVTGTSYLTALSLDATSALTGPRGRKVTMTVDGVATPITPGGGYTGAIVLRCACRVLPGVARARRGRVRPHHSA